MAKIPSIFKKILKNPSQAISFELAMVGILIAIVDLLGFQIPFIKSQTLLLFLVSYIILNDTLDQISESTLIAPKSNQSDDINSRLMELTKALQTAGLTISQIEGEINSRQNLVSKLETQKKIAEQAITMSKEQVDAVAAILSGEVSRQSKIDLRNEIIKDILIFILGVIVTLALNRL